MKVTVHRGGNIFEQEYEFGKPLYDVRAVGETTKNGTIVTFKPDNTIFITEKYDYEILSSRLRELAYLNKGITLTITDEREKTKQEITIPAHSSPKRACLILSTTSMPTAKN